MSPVRDLAAVVLAAGASSRMGSPKPLLRLGRELVIQRIVRTYREAGVDELRVVLGFDALSIAPAIDAIGTRWVRNSRPQRGMFSSVQAGVRELPTGLRGFFVHPADIPLVSAPTLLRLAAELRTPADILIPACAGRRGHPPLLGADLAAAILAYGGEGGLRGLLAARQAQLRIVECGDEGVLLDADTPEDWQRILRAAR